MESEGTKTEVEGVNCPLGGISDVNEFYAWALKHNLVGGPRVDHAAAAAVSGTKTEVEGVKRPLGAVSGVNEFYAWALKHNLISGPRVDHATAAVSGTKAQVGGKLCIKIQMPNPASSATGAASGGTKAQVGGKRPCAEIENPTSPAFATAFASGGTKTEVEGVKRPLGAVSDVNEIYAWALKHNLLWPPRVDHAAAAVSGTTTEMDEKKEYGYMPEEMDSEDLNVYRFEGGRLIPMGRRPKHPRMKMGPPLPHAITYEKICRKLDESKQAFLRAGVPWHPFLVSDDPSPTSIASTLAPKLDHSC